MCNLSTCTMTKTPVRVARTGSANRFKWEPVTTGKPVNRGSSIELCLALGVRACARTGWYTVSVYSSWVDSKVDILLLLLFLRSPATSLGFTVLGEIFAYVTVFVSLIYKVRPRVAGHAIVYGNPSLHLANTLSN